MRIGRAFAGSHRVLAVLLRWLAAFVLVGSIVAEGARWARASSPAAPADLAAQVYARLVIDGYDSAPPQPTLDDLRVALGDAAAGGRYYDPDNGEQYTYSYSDGSHENVVQAALGRSTWSDQNASQATQIADIKAVMNLLTWRKETDGQELNTGGGLVKEASTTFTESDCNTDSGTIVDDAASLYPSAQDGTAYVSGTEPDTGYQVIGEAGTSVEVNVPAYPEAEVLDVIVHSYRPLGMEQMQTANKKYPVLGARFLFAGYTNTGGGDNNWQPSPMTAEFATRPVSQGWVPDASDWSMDTGYHELGTTAPLPLESSPNPLYGHYDIPLSALYTPGTKKIAQDLVIATSSDEPPADWPPSGMACEYEEQYANIAQWTLLYQMDFSGPALDFAFKDLSSDFVEGIKSGEGKDILGAISYGGSTSFTGFTATVNWGDDTGTQDATIVKDSADPAYSPGDVVAQHAYADEGQFTITVSVTGPGGKKVTQTSQVTVGDAALKASGVGQITCEMGTPVTGTVAIFSDANPEATQSDFTSDTTIDWGDETTDDPDNITPDGTSFDVNGSHTYHDDEQYTVTTTIKDKGGQEATARTKVNCESPLQVTSALPTVTEGTAFTKTIATFVSGKDKSIETDDDMTASINWGDNSPVSSIASNTLTGGKLTGSHTYKEEGSYLVKYTIIDKGAPPAKGQTTIKVQDAKLHVSGEAIAAVEGAKFTGNAGYFVDDDEFGAAGDYTATIDWGDGAQTPGGIVADPTGGFFVTGTHTYKDEKTYHTTVTVKDAGGSAASATDGTAVVADAPLGTGTPNNFTVKAGVSFTKPLMSFTDSNPLGTASDFAASINWGDKTKPSRGLITGSGPFGVTGKHTYAHAGDYQAKVAVVDKGGKTTGAIAMIHVKVGALNGT